MGLALVRAAGAEEVRHSSEGSSNESEHETAGPWVGLGELR